MLGVRGRHETNGESPSLVEQSKDSVIKEHAESSSKKKPNHATSSPPKTKPNRYRVACPHKTQVPREARNRLASSVLCQSNLSSNLMLQKVVCPLSPQRIENPNKSAENHLLASVGILVGSCVPFSTANRKAARAPSLCVCVYLVLLHFSCVPHSH